jgi:ATP-dependent helicase/nuclease subunit A
LTHIPHRQGAAGLVELWPLQIAAPKVDPPRWDVAEEDTSIGNAQARRARALALRIRHMLAHETLPARSDGPGQPEGRRVRPEDILILVRRRNALTRLIIRELKKAEVPVGGLDRIALTAQIGVQDVLALLDVLLLPQDDLALAALLKSPLVGLSEEDVFGLECLGCIELKAEIDRLRALLEMARAEFSAAGLVISSSRSVSLRRMISVRPEPRSS